MRARISHSTPRGLLRALRTRVRQSRRATWQRGPRQGAHPVVHGGIAGSLRPPMGGRHVAGAVHHSQCPAKITRCPACVDRPIAARHMATSPHSLVPVHVKSRGPSCPRRTRACPRCTHLLVAVPAPARRRTPPPAHCRNNNFKPQNSFLGVRALKNTSK